MSKLARAPKIAREAMMAFRKTAETALVNLCQESAIIERSCESWITAATKTFTLHAEGLKKAEFPITTAALQPWVQFNP